MRAFYDNYLYTLVFEHLLSSEYGSGLYVVEFNGDDTRDHQNWCFIPRDQDNFGSLRKRAVQLNGFEEIPRRLSDCRPDSEDRMSNTMIQIVILSLEPS